MSKEPVRTSTPITVSYEDEPDIADLRALVSDQKNLPAETDNNSETELIKAEEPPCMISDSELNGLYDEIVSNHRDDRQKADQLLNTFEEMISNEGDASTSTKEALVALLKLRMEASEKMTKIADLKTRIKLKEANTFPPYMAPQTNVYLGGNPQAAIPDNKRDFLKKINDGKKQG